MTDQIQHLTRALVDRYVVERELGAGGMATVYLAEDLKHERHVAIKILRPELVAVLGPDRFLREIKLTARLNHPHILPLLDSGKAERFIYYVMPYVEGESFREKLNRETQLSVEDTLRYGEQVAAALHYAHMQNVMHRDIKPENILVHQDEAVVADFGIALALDAAGGDRLTETGLSIGTPEYMSPEQASGAKQLDARSDVYALGCVLHEWLVGEPPFSGPTPQAIIARQVLDPPPSIRTVRPSVPLAVEQVVVRALAKVPADRWQTADQMGAQLELVARQPANVVAAPVPPGTTEPTGTFSKKILLTSIAVIITAAVTIGVFASGIGTGALPEPRQTQLTFSGNVVWAEISPDGELLAYVENGDPNRLLVRDLTGESVIEVASIGAVTSTLRWSPDGSSLLFTGTDSDEEPIAVTYPRLGGAARPLPVEFGGDHVVRAAWAPDGSSVATWRMARVPGVNAIDIVAVGTGDIGSVRMPDSIEAFFDPGDWSPNGEFLAFASHDGVANVSLWTVAVDGSGWHRLLQDTSAFGEPRWAPSGRAIYSVRSTFGDAALWKIPVARQGHAQGDPERLAVRVGGVYVGGGVSVTSDGRKLVTIRDQTHSNLWLSTGSERNGGKFNAAQITHGTSIKGPGALSPDGKWIAYVELRGTAGDVFIVSTGGGAPKRVTSSGNASPPGPVWSPDGSRLAFGRYTDGVMKVQTILVNGRDPRTYEDTDVGTGGLAWAPGERILYPRREGRNVHLLNAETGEQAPLVTNDSVGWMGQPSYSSDGAKVAVYWNRAPQRGIWVIVLEDSSQHLLRAGTAYPTGWSVDGRSLFAQESGSNSILRIPLDGGAPSIIGALPFEVILHPSLCSAVGPAEGPSLICVVAESVHDAWMIENFDASER